MTRRVLTSGIALLLVAVAACSGSGGNSGASGKTGGLADPGTCTPIDVAVSSEKIALLTKLANDFNASQSHDLGNGKCAFARVQVKASGSAMQLLAQGWPDTAANGPQPVVWSPASSAWGAILNQRLADKQQPAMAPASDPIMLTPLVIAMPKPMADALGYPAKPVGYADILALARNPKGWGAYGHPEWGPFRLGKTNPNFSTSALHATIAQYYAATGKTSNLTLEDLNRPAVRQFARGVESAVVHYGDITMTFLNNWFRNDVRGTSLTYVSAVAIEEKSVIDYNQGNPDGVLDPGEQPRKPRIPLVAIYPKEGTLFSDSPFILLDAKWVDATERAGARAFEAFVKRPDSQRQALKYGFRPGDPAVAVSAPITTANGVDPKQPQAVLEVPKPEVLSRLLDRWAADRKRARVLLLLDVSGSMGEPGNDATGETKLDLAKKATVNALGEFEPDDQVGLRIFSTGLGAQQNQDSLDVVDIAALAGNRETMIRKLGDLAPTNGTPLYTATSSAYDDLLAKFDPQRINAVVLLTDGRNEDSRNNDLNALLQHLSAQAQGETAKPVRVFAIAYGKDADLETLRRIAEATNASVYDASDPTTISKIFVSVVSNF
ncbi:MAG: Ca-activated chloride channel [Actinomycetota bacterium]|jgi:Ca-activated chloride channel family protein|nr:Ca-activated chloride channel [Actinomycetota bacterium]